MPQAKEMEHVSQQSMNYENKEHKKNRQSLSQLPLIH
jgi:hypothetical protein